MADVRKMEEGMSEQDRRAIVRAIRAEGRRGLQTQDVLNASLGSVAQNNINQMQADPVDLGPAQMALLAEEVGGEVQSGQDYIEAQRAIFDQSRADRRAANAGYFDTVENTQVPAVDYALQRYADALEAQQAARAAAARRRTGGGGGGAEDEGSYGGFQHPAAADGGSAYGPNASYVEEAVGIIGPQWGGPVTDTFVQGAARGDSYREVEEDVYEFLLDQGFDPDVITDFLDDALARFGDLFNGNIGNAGSDNRRSEERDRNRYGGYDPVTGGVF